MRLRVAGLVMPLDFFALCVALADSKARKPRQAWWPGSISGFIHRLVYCKFSGLEEVAGNDFFKDDFLPDGNGQITSGATSLPDPVALQTEEVRSSSKVTRMIMMLLMQ